MTQAEADEYGQFSSVRVRYDGAEREAVLDWLKWGWVIMWVDGVGDARMATMLKVKPAKRGREQEPGKEKDA